MSLYHELKRRNVFRVAIAYLFALSVTSSFAQSDPIGRHYANPTLLPLDSEGIQMSQPEVLDINGDGRDDVAASMINEDNMNDPASLYIWTSNEAGSMENSTPVLIEGAVPVEDGGYRQIIPADFNGDGRLDLFLESQGPEPDCPPELPECWPGGQNSLLLSDNDGKLTNVTTTHLPEYMDFSHGSSVADFDGDGDVDIWVNSVGGGTIIYPTFAYLMHNDGEGHFTVVADLFNEGSPENDGIPVVGRSPILPEGTYRQGLWSIAIDVEGDGDMDLQLTRSFEADQSTNPWVFTYVNRLLVNDGTGRFDLLPGDSYPSVGCSVSPDQPDPEACKYDVLPYTHHALVYDLNLDGLDDMLLNTDYEGVKLPNLQVLISNGDGTFRDESSDRYPSVFPPGEFQLHDLDGDGHKDLFSDVNFGTSDIRINDGEGYFRRLADDWVVPIDWNWIVLDVDGDGGTDFLFDSYLGFFLSKMNLPYGAVLDGTAEDDRLIGGAHDNVYRGLAGNDVLDGGLGDDELDGGEGNDELIGGKGNDTYVYHASDLDDHDTISDKAGFDQLKFDGFNVGEVANAMQDGEGNLAINFSDGGSLTIEGHFQQGVYGVESLMVGGETLPLSRDPSFMAGSIQELTDPFTINAGLNDAWVSAEAPFQGMFITVFPVLKFMFAAWFTFDSQTPPEDATATFGAADQRWVTALGSFDGNRAELKAELTHGGSFNSSNPVPTQDTNYGTINIEFSHCNLASVEYDFPDAGASGFFTMTRVVESNVPLCDDLNVAVFQ
jgi:hypothetical protein